MYILAFESSCDDTCVAVLQGTQVRSNVISSQAEKHAQTGGVVPEVAAREHVRNLVPVLEMALREAQITPEQIDVVAATQGPGLISSLLVGANAASLWALNYHKPLVPVHHTVGHIYANWLDRAETEINFPLLVLTVSGGHNDLYLMTGHGQYQLLGQTLDDAAGEAFDKVARALGLGYPGGPAISRLAATLTTTPYTLPIAQTSAYDFSFSGLKSAVLRLIKESAGEESSTAAIALAFEKAVVQAFLAKVELAIREYRPAGLMLSGGVAANQRLRVDMTQLGQRYALPCLYPVSIAYCTDNAAMIGAAAYYLARNNLEKYQTWRNITPDPILDLVNFLS